MAEAFRRRLPRRDCTTGPPRMALILCSRWLPPAIAAVAEARRACESALAVASRSAAYSAGVAPVRSTASSQASSRSRRARENAIQGRGESQASMASRRRNSATRMSSRRACMCSWERVAARRSSDHRSASRGRTMRGWRIPARKAARLVEERLSATGPVPVASRANPAMRRSLRSWQGSEAARTDRVARMASAWWSARAEKPRSQIRPSRPTQSLAAGRAWMSAPPSGARKGAENRIWNIEPPLATRPDTAVSASASSSGGGAGACRRTGAAGSGTSGAGAGRPRSGRSMAPRRKAATMKANERAGWRRPRIQADRRAARAARLIVTAHRIAKGATARPRVISRSTIRAGPSWRP